MIRTASVLALVVGCGGTSYPQAEDPESTFSFSLLEEASPETQDRRVAWRMRSGVTVTAQRMAVSDSLVRERTVSGVAEALARRYALGEVEGTMTTAPCRAGGMSTTCTMGSMTAPAERGGGRYVKRGVLLEIRDEIVLLEVLGPESKREQVDAQAELMEQTLTLGG